MLKSRYTLLITIIAIISISPRKNNGQDDAQIGSLSQSDTLILKGVSILMVIIGHLRQAIPGLRIFTPLGAMGVGVS